MKKTMFIICSAIITIFSFLLYASTPVTIRSGTTRNIPATGEEDWGDEVTNWIIDATAAINASPQTQYSRRFTAVVGNSTEVTAGNASHSTLASAVNFATSGGSIYIMDGTHFVTSAVNITKPLTIIGDGYKSFIVSSTGDFSTSAIINFQTSGITLSQVTFSTSTPTQYILNLNSNATDAHIDVRVSGMATNGFMTDSTVNDNNKYGHYIWGTSGKSLNTLSYLYDASIVNPQTDDGLFRYNGKWVNKSIAGATNEINVTQSAGTVTIGIVDPLSTTKGGTGFSTIGTSNQVLSVNNAGSALEYKTIDATSPISVSRGTGFITVGLGTVTTAKGGTGLTSWTSGDVPYYASGTALSKLGANTTTTPKCLFQTSSVPYWNTLSYTDVPISVVGTASEINISSGNGFFTVGLIDPIAVSKGGTNNTTIGTNQITYGKGTFYTSDSNFFYNGTYSYLGTSPAFTVFPKFGIFSRVTDPATNPRGSLAVYDDNEYNTSGLGGYIGFGGKYNSVGDVAIYGGISGQKTNTTDGNYAGDLVFWKRVNGSTPTEGMRLTNTGRLTIGSSSDLGQLLSLKGTATDVGAAIAFQPNGTTNTGYVGVANAANNYISGSATDDLIVRSAGNILFGNGTSERMRITAAGGLTVPGVYSTTVGATNRDVYVDNTGVIGYVSSSKRYKTNLRPFDSSTIENVSKLEPVRFDYIDPRRGKDQIGFIAEDVAKIFPELVSYNPDGKIETIQYSKLAVVLTGGIKDLYKENKKLKARLDDLEKRLLKLEKKGN